MLRKIALLRLHAAWDRCVFVERERGPRSFGGTQILVPEQIGDVGEADAGHAQVPTKL